jgi:hypothetical protein
MVIADLSHRPLTNGWRGWLNTKSSRWGGVFEGAEVVVHLAANANQLASWQAVLSNNIQATWNVLEMAVKYQVPRMVFASSNYAIKALEHKLAPACYLPDGPKIGSDDPPHPTTPYGVSKAFGELTGRMFVDEQKFRSYVAVRIGIYNSALRDHIEQRSLWIGVGDMRSLLRRCVEAEFEGFHVVYGVSAQATSPYDLSHTRRLLCWEPREMP